MEILQLGAISKLTRDSPQDRDYLPDCFCGLCWHTKKPSYEGSQKCNMAGRWRLEKRGPGSLCWNRATQVWGIPGYIFLASPPCFCRRGICCRFWLTAASPGQLLRHFRCPKWHWVPSFRPRLPMQPLCAVALPMHCPGTADSQWPESCTSSTWIDLVTCN